MADRQTEARELNAHPNANLKQITQPGLKTLLRTPQPRAESLASPVRPLPRLIPLHDSLSLRRTTESRSAPTVKRPRFSPDDRPRTGLHRSLGLE